MSRVLHASTGKVIDWHRPLDLKEFAQAIGTDIVQPFWFGIGPSERGKVTFAALTDEEGWIRREAVPTCDLQGGRPREAHPRLSLVLTGHVYVVRWNHAKTASNPIEPLADGDFFEATEVPKEKTQMKNLTYWIVRLGRYHFPPLFF